MQPTLALQCTSLVQNIIPYLHWAWFAFCDQERGGGLGGLGGAGTGGPPLYLQNLSWRSR